MSTLGYRSDFLGEDKVFELPTISFEHLSRLSWKWSTAFRR